MIETMSYYATVAVTLMFLSLERIFYILACHRSQFVASMAHTVTGVKGGEPEFILGMVHFFKTIQIGVFLFWYYTNFGMTLMSLPSTAVCSGAAFIFACGQVLNALTWYRLGVEGVCYGVKFGRKVPWCSAFPFTVMNNPQYTGAILTVWGLFLLASEALPAKDWMMIPAIETGLYVMSMHAEY